MQWRPVFAAMWPWPASRPPSLQPFITAAITVVIAASLGGRHLRAMAASHRGRHPCGHVGQSSWTAAIPVAMAGHSLRPAAIQVAIAADRLPRGHGGMSVPRPFPRRWWPVLAAAIPVTTTSNRGRHPCGHVGQSSRTATIPLAMAASLRGRHPRGHGSQSWRPPSLWPWRPVIAAAILVAMASSFRGRPPFPWAWLASPCGHGGQSSRPAVIPLS